MPDGEPRAAWTLTLPPHPTAPAAARRRVASALENGTLRELADTATLLVSEVVTNAVLHAATDIQLSYRVERGSISVEVRDRSAAFPSPRFYDPAATTGRGLDMVENLADAWGVEVDEHGKTVWFRLDGPDADAGAPRDQTGTSAGDDLLDVHLLNLPVELVLATVEYGDALLREMFLVAISSADGHGRDHATTPGIDLGPLLSQVDEAHRAGRRTVDLVVGFPRDAGATVLQRLALVDEADRMAHDGEVLMPPAVPEIGACRRWLLGQIALQADGAAPEPWTMPEPGETSDRPMRLPDSDLQALDALVEGAIVADDANRILYVNGAAAEALGWEPEQLVGRRLTAIVPTELRAAHLAGFTRCLLSGEGRLLGERSRLPALRSDGSVVVVDITIDVATIAGRQLFRATFS